MTDSAHIRRSIEQVAQFFAEHPHKGRSTDSAAVAVIEDGLRCRAEGPRGALLVTDMPGPIGGGGAAPTPGWFLRAALASCDATVIAMRAAQLGVALSRLEVTVDGESDGRGLLGLAGALPGPIGLRVQVRIAAADETPAAQLRELVHWAEAHSPVGDALRRALPVALDVQLC